MCVVGGEVLFGGGLCFIQVEIVKLHKTPRRSSVRFYVFVQVQPNSSSTQRDTGFDASVLCWEASFQKGINVELAIVR